MSHDTRTTRRTVSRFGHNQRLAFAAVWSRLGLAALLWLVPCGFLSAQHVFQTTNTSGNYIIGRTIYLTGNQTIWYKTSKYPNNWTQANLSSIGTPAFNWGDGSGGLSSGWNAFTLSADAPYHGTAPAASGTIQYCFQNPEIVTTNNPISTVTVTIPSYPVEIDLTTSGQAEFGTYVYYEISSATISITPGGITLQDPYAGTGFNGPWPLNELAGKKITLPFYPAELQNTVAFSVGGISYLVPCDPAKVVDLSFVVPPNWDGTVQMNGQSVDLIHGLAWADSVNGALFASPYSSSPPGGMSQWQPSGTYNLPDGVSPLDVGLPSGVTANSKLPLPAGMTSVTNSQALGMLQSQITRSDGSSAITVISPSAATTGTAVPPTSGGGSGASNVSYNTTNYYNGGSSAPTNSATGTALGSRPIPGSDDKGQDGTGLAAIPGKVSTLTGKFHDRFSRLNPIKNPGSVGMQSTYDLAIDFGTFGSVNRTIDFSKAPWTWMRGAEVVFLAFMFSNAFMKRVTI